MIFNKFFKKKKWLSDKVSDRIAAVAELDTSDSANKTIMHELAFNDGDDKVRRAALDKLNDFALYWQAFKKDASETLRKYSEKTIIESLTGKRDTGLDSKLKAEFIKECNKSQLLEKVVFELNDETLTKQTIQKLNKEPLYYKAVTDSDLSESTKQELLEYFNEPAQLRKLAKKLTGELLSFVEQRLEQQKLAAEKPVKLEKNLRLALAQLNALKDKHDVADIEAKMAEIDELWQSAELAILPELIQSELTNKYQTISAALNRILAPKKEAWLQEQEQQQFVARCQSNFQQLNEQLTILESDVTQSIIDAVEISQDVITAKINEIEKQAGALEITSEQKSKVLTRAESLFNRAGQLPLIQQGIEQAKVLIETFKGLALPTDLKSLNLVSQEFKQVKKQWQDNLKQVDIAMPASLVGEFDTLLNTWQPAVIELEKQQRQLFSQTRRKMSELENLVNIGKFHSAFGLFKKLGFWIEDLNDYQVGQIERKWQSLQEDIDNLHDLEKSFSNPKKQELLNDIRQLAETPLVDPTEQAHRVRLLRSNWQSLGHAEDDQEQTLNDEFNQLCETAFAPCRDHYKELEDERQANLDAKTLLIEQMETLATNLKSAEVSDWRSVESLFVKITKLWRETGLIDREKVAAVNKRYQGAVKPVKDAISAYHAENQNEKNKLIEQAQQLVDAEMDIAVKTDQLKRLQQQWKNVGFAGSKIDQKLWNKFRAINNPIFEQRDSAKKEEVEANKQEFKEHQQKLNDIKQQLQQELALAEIRELSAAASDVIAAVSGLPRGDFDKLKKLSQTIQKNVDDKIAKIRQDKEKQDYVDMFAAVELIANGESAELSGLKSAWQSAINNNNKSDREEVTLQIEICANVSSPADAKETRNKVQMAMLSDKLEQGVEYGLQDLLETWLGAGMFEPKDIILLDRIKPVYL